METDTIEENVECSGKGAPCTESQQKEDEETMSQSGTQNSDSPKRKMEIPPGMSKNQMKKMLRNQRWQEMKPTKRAQERQRKKEKRKALKESGAQLPPNRKVLKRNCMKNSSCKTKIAIDCSFDDLMVDKDISKVVKQLNYCYSANRRREDPVQFYITGFSSKTKSRMEEIGDYKGWDVYFKTEDYVDVFGRDKVVYLTSDSPNMVAELDDDKAYMIGGLVDHNHQKGLCYKLAQEKGIAHAQLPIGEYLAMKSRKVLTINHVFEILLEFTATHSWEAAFHKVIPGRKVEHFKTASKTTDANSSAEVQEEEEEQGKEEEQEQEQEDATENRAQTQNDLGAETSVKTQNTEAKVEVCQSKSDPTQQEASSSQQTQVAAQNSNETLQQQPLPQQQRPQQQQQQQI